MSPSLHGPQGVKLVVSFIILDILAVASVILRFYGIFLKRMQIKTYDALCVVSLVTLLGYSIALVIGTVKGGIGLHVAEVSATELVVGLKTFFASQFMWGVSICAFRLAVLLLYIEVFGTAKCFRRAAWTGVVIVCLFYIGALTTTLRLCQPVAYNWDLTLKGYCGNEGEAEMWAAAINMVLDVGIVALPLPIVWGLQMRTTRKIGITVTFGLGLGIAAINLARIVKVLQCNVSTDFTFCTLDSAILTVAEMAVGIMVACIPKMGPVFRRAPDQKQPAGSSAQALRYNGYRSGAGKFGGRSGNSNTNRFRLHNSEVTNSMEAIYNKPSYCQGPVSKLRETGDAEMQLELGPWEGNPSAFAVHTPQQTFWQSPGMTETQGGGIRVERKFGISGTELR